MTYDSIDVQYLKKNAKLPVNYYTIQYLSLYLQTNNINY